MILNTLYISKSIWSKGYNYIYRVYMIPSFSYGNLYTQLIHSAIGTVGLKSPPIFTDRPNLKRSKKEKSLTARNNHHDYFRLKFTQETIWLSTLANLLINIKCNLLNFTNFYDQFINRLKERCKYNQLNVFFK